MSAGPPCVRGWPHAPTPPSTAPGRDDRRHPKPKGLLDAGVLTQEEFDAAKAKLLST
jgi:hypothetical protein